MSLESNAETIMAPYCIPLVFVDDLERLTDIDVTYANL